ncbi:MULTISPECIES: DeoR/GlpR family DNA-binding transcription regulator [Streptomyces]|uniref:DeoR family transcriptional regulator n=1 Tax=Streptomyces cacaoi TaxID=1898 RepID=A0A4Y3QSW4_STRCI|nr:MULTISPECIES: DeoR/GlpR family DNA-binding transcription regulator [Streptomyces]NNG89767.1 DeoR/GlpR transcriptional regulator [Streptomyces cacaoi]QHF95743.1 DeoR/GlpR transcriptional regulator [Streptomyces sp. NHF165]GEB47777.1 DeoR family transcriptional regulator [Streptomyces cacaoi]
MTPAGGGGGGAGPARSQQDRRQLIAEQVVRHGTVSVAWLARTTGVSVMTVHRDLDALAGRGVLRRFRGGVSALPTSVFESSLDYRAGVRVAEKDALARAAAALVEPGMSVMLDDSSSALALARLLPGKVPLTVLTNARRVIDVLADCEEIRLIALGGEYSHTHDSFLGGACVESIEALSVDLVVVSTSAMNTRLTFHQEPDVVLVKRAMLASAARRVLLMDHSKIPRTALHRVCPVAGFEHVVVDEGVDRGLVAELREQVADVRVAALD